jgi:hypothetical protein
LICRGGWRSLAGWLAGLACLPQLPPAWAAAFHLICCSLLLPSLSRLPPADVDCRRARLLPMGGHCVALSEQFPFCPSLSCLALGPPLASCSLNG